MSRSTFSAAYTNASDATYTAWAYGLSQALDACGFFPKTADTGQVDWTPDRPAPSGINTFPDFEIRYLNDALHGTQPLYVRLDYGEAAVTNMPECALHSACFRLMALVRLRMASHTVLTALGQVLALSRQAPLAAT